LSECSICTHSASCNASAAKIDVMTHMEPVEGFLWPDQAEEIDRGPFETSTPLDDAAYSDGEGYHA
jgi:hypothetical protein